MKCIVCCEENNSLSNREDLEDQLVVIFFIQKFFESPLLVNSNNNNKKGGLVELLQSCGNPSEWVGFCGECTDIVRRAKGLYAQLTKIQSQLNKCRAQIEERAWQSLLKLKVVVDKKLSRKTEVVKRSLRQRIKSVRKGGTGEVDS